MEELELLKKENALLRAKIKDLMDVLRFCAMPNVGTYYQQQSAMEMVVNNKKLIWDRFNENGTYNQKHKDWLVENFGQEAIVEIEKIEKKLLS
jgi:hypothetical protein